MNIDVNGRTIETDEQGYLQNLDEWSEDVAAAVAKRDNIELKEDHWGLIGYFRDYYAEVRRHPTMRKLVLTLGKQHGKRFHEEKEYEKYLYKLFPSDPVHQLCKLAGLPKPLSDLE